MTRKVSSGVLGAAKIGIETVIPAVRRAEASRVDAIASRDIAKARRAAFRSARNGGWERS